MSLRLQLFRWLACALILSLCVNVYAVPDNTPEARQVREFLRPLPILRIAVIEADGNGHQAVAAQLVKRLREVGYQGEIEVLYAAKTKAKMEFLFPPFRSNGSNRQYFEGPNLMFSPLEDRPLKHMFFGLVAGDYNQRSFQHPHLSPDQLNVQYLLTIQPPRWGDHPSLRWVRSVSRLRQVEHDLPTHVRFEPPSDETRFLQDQMTHAPALAMKIPGLTELLNLKHQGKVDLLSAYGLGYNGSKKLAYLVSALVKAREHKPELLRRPIVVGLLSNLTSDEWSEFETELQKNNLSKSIAVLDVTSSSLSNEILRKDESSVVIFKIGTVTPDVWNLLNYESTLPPLAAGANGVNFLLGLGRPFIITKRSFPLVNRIAGQPVSQKILQITHSMTMFLEIGAVDFLAEFYIQSQNVDSDLNVTFRRFGEMVANLPDRSCSALLVAANRIEHMEKDQTFKRLSEAESWLRRLLGVP